MGVPKFFRWASTRYPAILSDIITAHNPLPPIDMLFLDMNGIIHHCSHNDDKVTKKWSIEQVVERVEKTLLHLIDELVKPQVLVYFAIDGVAPRAKLNQQRARRYRAARELEKERESADDAEGMFDSNCITPGTEFMREISNKLLEFIATQKATSAYWNSLNIVFSGSEVPGEGEHKIISYLRDMKEQSLLPPNSRYCLYGADADMIMLSLATHEPYIVVLREINQIDTSNRQPHNGGKPTPNHTNNNAEQHSPDPHHHHQTPQQAEDSIVRKPMQFIRINVLREYLWNEFSADLQLAHHQPGEEELQWGDENENDVEVLPHTSSEEKLGGAGSGGDESHSEVLQMERLIDDFVFLTYLIGNDFLPHLPGLDINDNAFDIIFDAYKTIFSTHPGYLIHHGKLDYARVELLFSLIGTTQVVVFEEQKANHRFRDKTTYEALDDVTPATPNSEDNTSDTPLTPPPHGSNHHEKEGHHRRHNSHGEGESDRQPHHHRTGSDLTSRQKYYITKLGFHPDLPATPSEGTVTLREVVKEYLQGLEWCLAYYTRGCISWDWFYPFNYGPFLQDMTSLGEAAAKISFALAQPLLPFQQLLACLPPQSAPLLPAALRHLVVSDTSPLIRFYPRDFEIDMNGKKREYEAVVLLPFIDIHLLTTASEECWELLTEEERQRNGFGKVHYFMPHEKDEQLFDFKIAPSDAFRSELIPGTLDKIAGFPSVLEVQSVGKAFYFVGGRAGGGGGGRGKGGR